MGFRYAAMRAAGALPVDGSVMNCDDGSVFLEAEGEQDALQQLLEAVRRSAAGSGISSAEVRWDEPQGRCRGFRIRYHRFA